MRRALLLPLLLIGCATAPTRVIVGLDPGSRVDLDAWLAAHPLAVSEELKAVPVGAIGTTSYAIVQVRGRERAHVHADHDLTVHVLRGRGRLALFHAAGVTEFTGEVRPLAAGDVAAIPRGMVHWFVNGGREPAVAVASFTPPYDGMDIVTTPLIAAMDEAVTRAAPSAGPVTVTGRREDAAAPFAVTLTPAPGP